MCMHVCVYVCCRTRCSAVPVRLPRTLPIIIRVSQVALLRGSRRSFYLEVEIGPGMMDEHDGESVHHLFNELRGRCKNMLNPATRLSMPSTSISCQQTQTFHQLPSQPAKGQRNKSFTESSCIFREFVPMLDPATSAGWDIFLLVHSYLYSAMGLLCRIAFCFSLIHYLKNMYI